MQATLLFVDHKVGRMFHSATFQDTPVIPQMNSMVKVNGTYLRVKDIFYKYSEGATIITGGHAAHHGEEVVEVEILCEHIGG